MSLAALRRSSRAVALWLLIASLFGLPHRAESDEFCAPLGGQHDAARHVISAPADAAGEEHCAVCHWLRSVNPAPTSSSSTALAPIAASALAASAVAALRDPAASQIAARAPPSSLL